MELVLLRTKRIQYRENKMIKIDIEGFTYKATSGDQKIFNTVNIMAVTCIYGMDISQRERVWENYN
ncbi:hypothetical protein KUTeg_012282 [Tegillarca granosa]|uniref:Uncharacterized protein n=1 Tax=Tegillarca granosa TaxID=220873 RepID=A0ABQ9EZ26_TEGGR|nr:hypothetical protein KUTeg_012282 [Tegillarca granosa]